jgi:hypothetical protein
MYIPVTFQTLIETVPDTYVFSKIQRTVVSDSGQYMCSVISFVLVDVYL